MKDITSDRIGDENSLVFTGEYTFSIRCGKCADIHNAQLEGKNTKPCDCDCHANVTPPYQPYVPYYPPCPCPCPQYPYYYTTTGTGDPMPPQGYTTCKNEDNMNLGGIKTQNCSTHDEYNPTAGGCTCLD